MAHTFLPQSAWCVLNGYLYPWKQQPRHGKNAVSPREKLPQKKLSYLTEVVSCTLNGVALACNVEFRTQRDITLHSQGCHDCTGITKDEPVRPVHLVLGELHRLPVFLFRIKKEVPLGILPFRYPQNGLGRNAHGCAKLPDRQRTTVAPVSLPTPATARDCSGLP